MLVLLQMLTNVSPTYKVEVSISHICKTVDFKVRYLEVQETIVLKDIQNDLDELDTFC
jgi:hypothetical protein